MELGSEIQLNKATEKSWQFLSRALDMSIKPESSFNLEDLPNKFILPRTWQNKIRQVAEKTVDGNREFGVVGYLPSSKFQVQDINFGKLIRGSRVDVKFNMREKRLFFSMGNAILDIHGHPPSRFLGLSPNGQDRFFGNVSSPSGQDLMHLLSAQSTVLEFIVLSTDKPTTDIELLIKCPKSPIITNNEDLNQIGDCFDNMVIKPIEELVRNNSLHLVDFKRFFSTFAETYQIGYYSSYDLASATHRDLSDKKNTNSFNKNLSTFRSA